MRKVTPAERCGRQCRRRVLPILLVVLSMGLGACDPQIPAYPQENLSADDQRLVFRLRGVGFSELFVDSIPVVHGVNILTEQGDYFFGSGTLSLKGRSIEASGYRAVPMRLRFVWRDGYEMRDGDSPISAGIYTGGTVLGDYTIPIAARLPDEVLDAVRSGRGGLRLKFRIHADGPLVGWDVSNAQGTLLAGGDFREADLYNGEVVRKGWYIHPKTKQRIETDF
jgi:hypothetical protein